MNTETMLLFVLNIGLLGAAIGVLMAARAMSKAQKDEAERLYLALPPQWQNTILKLIEAAEAVLKVAKDVTDGQENSVG